MAGISAGIVIVTGFVVVLAATGSCRFSLWLLILGKVSVDFVDLRVWVRDVLDCRGLVSLAAADALVHGWPADFVTKKEN